MTEDDERIEKIKSYIDAYNRIAVEDMIAPLSQRVRFEHVQDGEIAITTSGIEAFVELATKSANLFRSRAQDILDITIEGDRITLSVAYRAVLKDGQEMKGTGLSHFTFSGPDIIAIRDEA